MPKPIIQILYGRDTLTKELLLKEDIQDESLIPLVYLIINQHPEKYDIKADSSYIFIVMRETIPRKWIYVRSDDAVLMLRWPSNTPLEKGTKIIFEFFYSYYLKDTKARLGNRCTRKIIYF